tara:strand:+ start:188 stop:694 length:507 start_codon:yes stop_codon:yes gene_type:complete
MYKLLYLPIILIFAFVTNTLKADTLSKDAYERGVNETCIDYLTQIEASYGLSGLNITFAHPINPSNLPSLHFSSKKYNNGSSTFSATLIPDKQYCYLSTVFTTSVNNQNCSEINLLKIKEDPSLISNSFDEGSYTIITPADNSYQLVLTTSGERACTITETQMVWPGK